MGRVRHRHPLLAPLRLHGGDVEDEVGVEDALARVLAAHHPAVLPEGVADPADVQVVLGDLHLPAHGEGLAGVLTVGVAAVRLEKYLVLLTFPANIILHSLSRLFLRDNFKPEMSIFANHLTGGGREDVTYLDEFCSPSS